MANRTKFQKGINKLVKCRMCGKLTHSTIDGNRDLQLCRDCTEESGWENTHSDEGHTTANPDADCPICKRAKERV